MSPLAISWVLSTVSGYGVYGLQIAMQYLRRGGLARDFIVTSDPLATTLPTMQQERLTPILQMASRIHRHLQDNPQEKLAFKHAVLHACSSDFSGFMGQERVWGEPNVACAAIEHMVCTQHGREVAKSYHKFITISQWNTDYLNSLNVGPVHLCYQGIDPTLFFPGPSTGLYRDRFVVFSGGKFEFRKGQDIVVAAFKRFQATHPDALLVACWQNLLRADAGAFALAGHCAEVPEPAPGFGIQITPWLLKQGLPEGSFIDLPFTHNLLMPGVLRECDVAIFPNRCEGGTNLVAMEAMACGVPTFVAYNTGQKDLVDLLGFPAFRTQGPVQASVSMRTVADWGESSVEEVVAALEYAYDKRTQARAEAAAGAERVKAWNWADLNEKLLGIVCG